MMTSDDLRMNFNFGLNLKGELIEDLREALSEPMEEMKKVLAESKNDFLKNIDTAIETNTENGWCITGQMDPREYMDIAEHAKDSTVRDIKFTEMYERDGFLEKEMKDILADTPNEWGDVIRDTFSLIYEDRYRVTFPLLMSFIEFKIANFIGTDKYGGELKAKVKKYRHEFDEGEVDYYTYVAVSNLILHAFFKRHNFAEEREVNLNRNWLQHGRDNPKMWDKVDLYKVLSVLSGISFMNTRFEAK